jgi:hypothetical protein
LLYHRAGIYRQFEQGTESGNKRRRNGDTELQWSRRFFILLGDRAVVPELDRTDLYFDGDYLRGELKMSRLLRIVALVLLFVSCRVLFADQVKQFNIVKSDPNVKALDHCGDDGTCFSIALSAPGNITSIQFTCEGSACGWVHPCPDGGKCNQHAYEYELAGNTAVWYGWTNSGDPHAVYKFLIHYQ